MNDLKTIYYHCICDLNKSVYVGLTDKGFWDHHKEAGFIEPEIMNERETKIIQKTMEKYGFTLLDYHQPILFTHDFVPKTEDDKIHIDHLVKLALFDIACSDTAISYTVNNNADFSAACRNGAVQEVALRDLEEFDIERD